MPDLHSQPAAHDVTTFPTPNATGDEASGTDALAHLAKMSGTGSTFGAADYVAINVVAVSSLIIAFAGALALVINLFLFLPIIAIGCGLLAIRQIRNSNGTQGGYGFAIGGIVVALAIGGVVGTREVRDWVRFRTETRDVAALISQFGKEVNSGNYDRAYNLMTDDFHSRCDRATFGATLEQLQHIPSYGRLESVEWNGEGMQFEDVADVETRGACMALIKCQEMKEAARELVRFTNKDGSWRIESIPRLFAEKSRRGV